MEISDQMLLNQNPDEFYSQLYNLLIERLPPGLRHLKHVLKPGMKFTVFRFPDKPKTTYELHFSPSSSHHAKYFGEGYHEILALYYTDTANELNRWLEAVRVYQPHVRKMLARDIVIGLWGTKWAWMAVDLAKDNVEYDLHSYSTIMSHFVQATYIPAVIALKVVKSGF